MRPSPLTILAVVIVTFFVVLVVVRGPIDADYWWHLTTGELILEQRAIPTADPYSFAYDGPWVAHEWLGEVLIYGLASTLGYPITAGLFGIATASSLLLPAYALDRTGVSARALFPWIAIGTYTLASFATVRPQVLSWLFLGALIAILIGLRPRHRLRPWLVPGLFIIWANVHGLWVVGLAVLSVYVAFTVLGRTPFAPQRQTALGIAAASLIGTALTPAGFGGLLYPLRYLRQDDWGTAFIAEWQAANITDPRQWGLFVLIAATLALGWRGSRGWLTPVALLGLLAGVIAVRNQPLTAILTLPMLAIVLDAWLRVSPRVPTASAGTRRVMEMLVAAVVVFAIVIILPVVASGKVDRTFPVAAFDRLIAAHPSTRTLVEYDWAGYAIHRLDQTGGSVFIDGRSDMYPRSVFEDYLTMRSAESGWEALASDYGVETIVMPPSAPIAAVTPTSGWCVEYEDSQAVMLVRCSTS